MEFNVTTEERVRVTAAPTTKSGSPAQLDGPLQVSVVGGDGTAEQVAGDPLSVLCVSGSSPGDVTFLVSADADLGDGVQTISEPVTLHVSNPLAANLGLSGTVEPK